MYTFNNKLHLVSLLALQACTNVMGASATSGVLEVDLVFPRNETYAPAAQMPIIFAIQNPHLVAPLNMKVSYIITPPHNYNNFTEPDLFDLNSIGPSDSDPYFLHNNTDLVNTESTWELTWFVEYGRCTGSSGDIMFYPSNSTIDSIIFTTKSGATKPVLNAVSKKDTCATGIAAWNVTGAMDVEGADWGGHDTCAVVSKKSPWATMDPCAIKLDSATVSNISATLNATADEKEDPATDNAGAVHLPVKILLLLTYGVLEIGIEDGIAVPLRGRRKRSAPSDNDDVDPSPPARKIKTDTPPTSSREEGHTAGGKPIPNAELTLACFQCPKTYSDYNGVKRHFRTSHLTDRKCNFCDLFVLHEMHLRSHAQGVHSLQT